MINLTNASIEGSLFISNKVDSCVGPFEGPSHFSYVGGAISIVSILQSKFFGNGAEVDGVLYAFHSNITTVNSTFAENHMHAPDGPFMINDLQHWTQFFILQLFNS